jgi:hypothetical protein
MTATKTAENSTEFDQCLTIEFLTSCPNRDGIKSARGAVAPPEGYGISAGSNPGSLTGKMIVSYPDQVRQSSSHEQTEQRNGDRHSEYPPDREIPTIMLIQGASINLINLVPELDAFVH